VRHKDPLSVRILIVGMYASLYIWPQIPCISRHFSAGEKGGCLLYGGGAYTFPCELVSRKEYLVHDQRATKRATNGITYKSRYVIIRASISRIWSLIYPYIYTLSICASHILVQQ